MERMDKKMKDGASNQILDTNEIDWAIRPLILKLNSYEGIETAGSCSGHPQNGKARAYIYFLDTNHTNLDKALTFFEEYGFKVIQPDYDTKWYGIDIILEKSSGDITEEDIRVFWENVEGGFLKRIENNK